MERLSGADANFLNMETRYWHQHVAGLTILDISEAPDFGFDTVVETLHERLPYAPKFRWMLKSVPFDLDRPVWVDDNDFDLRRHVHRAAVPSPGGPREVAEVTGQILGHQLDRRHPLWEMWLLEGLANDRVALVMKYHHCLLDGMAGASLASVLMDLEAHPPPDAPRPELPVQSAGAVPSDAELLARSLVPTLATGPRMMRYAAQMLNRGVTAAAFSRRADVEVPNITDIPTTSFNAPIGPRRGVSMASVSLEDVKAIRAAAGVKVNDVVIALSAGALRSWLTAQDELPDKPLVAGVPISTRSDGDTAQDNQIATMQVSMATDEDDPVERLEAIFRSSQSSKAMTEAVRAKKIQSVGETAPPLLLNLAIRSAANSGILDRMPTFMNLIVSNMPGPPMPIYTAGARVTGIYSTGPIMETMGLNITVFSYDGRIDFGFHCDPDLIDDVWEIAEEIPAALAELMEALDLGPPGDFDDAFGRSS